VQQEKDRLEARGNFDAIPIYCTCGVGDPRVVNLPVTGPYFALDFTTPVGISTGKSRSLAEIEQSLDRQKLAYEQSISVAGKSAPIADAIQTTLGSDSIYEPEGRRVISPVSRLWSVGWGGYVIFDWDNFFAATMAGIGDRDLAYANAIETLRESTAQGFVPNYARAKGWKSSDRSEPPVGAIRSHCADPQPVNGSPARLSLPVHIMPRFQHLAVQDIGVHELQQFATELKTKVSRNTTIGVMCTVFGVLEYAEKCKMKVSELTSNIVRPRPNPTRRSSPVNKLPISSPQQESRSKHCLPSRGIQVRVPVN
jgi:hypothetical protein